MFWIVFAIAALLLLLYCFLILLYRRWYLRLPVFTGEAVGAAATSFSVVIPARNEEENIEACVHSVFGQQYPASLIEVIVVNDHSADRTEALVRKMQERYPGLRLLNLAELADTKALNAYKKKAIELAIARSQGDWIVTTDADCVVSDQWLSLFDRYIRQNQPVFIAAPVVFSNDGSFLSVFQALDFMSLQGITAAAVSAGYHTMCNGANIAYRKKVFEEVGQFAGIDHVASGDDMLLMYKIKQAYPAKLGYLHHPAAIVATAPMQNWPDFLNQRIRWASKAGQYKDKSIFWTLFLVYAVNALLCGLFCWGWFVRDGILAWLMLIGIKTLIELTLMLPVASFFKQKNVLVWFPLMQPFHILYTVVAGGLGKFGTYKWKERKVR